MKNLKGFIICCILFGTSFFAFSQNKSAADYKEQNIDPTGIVRDNQGKVMGSIDGTGVVFDDNKTKLGSIDANGVVKDKDGKLLGKTAKNGTFKDMKGEVEVTVDDKGKECEIKDGKGKKLGTTHANYKSQACIVHCFFMDKK